MMSAKDAGLMVLARLLLHRDAPTARHAIGPQAFHRMTD